MKYALDREAALQILDEYATKDGWIRMTLVRGALLEPKPTDIDVAATYRKAVGLGLLPRELAMDARMAQLLAMDT